MELNELIAEFNGKYNVNFSIDDFKKEISNCYNANKKLGMNEASIKAFDNTIKSLYRQVALNKCQKRTGNYVSSTDMFDEFSTIVNQYQKTEEGNKIFGSSMIGAHEELEKNKLIYDSIKDLKKNPSIAYAELYKNGNLPIRKMREDLRGYLTNDYPSKKDMAIGLLYAQALKEVNESRSFWWKLFHPIRNNAEKKYANIFTEKIEKTISFEAEANSQDILNALLDPNLKSTENIITKDTLSWCKTFNPLKEDFQSIENAIESEGGSIEEGVEILDASEPDEGFVLMGNEQKEQIIVDLNESKVEDFSQPIDDKQESLIIDNQKTN